MTGEKILGIDLGTTNSAMAIMQDGDPEIIPNSEGYRTTPSVVSMSDGELLVGEPAKNQAVQNVEDTATGIKRVMGKRTTSASLGDRELEPEEVSGKILQKLKHDAETYLGEEIEKAVITVPAYFSDRQRQATKAAGEIAGFEVERIINEPTAAAMAYGFNKNVNQTVLVYDLGGGTFDISILEIGEGVFEVVSTNGVNGLGGNDWDNQIIEWAVDEFYKEHGLDIGSDRQALQRLTDAAEEAKTELTSRPETTLSVPFILADDEGQYDLNLTLTRQNFESMTQDLLEQTIAPMENAIQEANLSTAEIDEVLLTGGATRMPAVQETVKELTGKQPRKNINPDEAVALGAAIQGGVLAGDAEDIALVDVTPLSLGVEVQGGLFEPIIERNTRIPTRVSKDFTTAEDGQTQVEIRVFQGEREIAEENELLGEFQLTGIPPQDAGVPRIEVRFKIDTNGIVQVSAEDSNTGASEDIEIEGTAGLTDEEIERMKEDAERHAEQDRRRRSFIKARNRLQQSLEQAQRLIENNPSHESMPELERMVSDAEGIIERSNGLSFGEENTVTKDVLNDAHNEFEEFLAEITVGAESESEPSDSRLAE